MTQRVNSYHNRRLDNFGDQRILKTIHQWYILFLSILVLILLVSCTSQESSKNRSKVRISDRPISAQKPILVADPTDKMSTLNGLVCFKCHNILTIGEQPERISFSHKNHLRRGYHCQVCHPYSGHKGHVGPRMATCMQCHDGKQASNRCLLCHIKTGEIIPKSHRVKWATTHGKAGERGKNCYNCHETKYCFSCHQLKLPHPPDWKKKSHGKPAKENLLVCGRCHLERMCQDCHRVPMPHSTDYVRKHPIKSEERKVCSNCHNESFCQSCHERKNPHTLDWGTTHGEQAKKSWQPCMVCHKDSFCKDCHETGLPHPTDWKDWHKQAARTDPDLCFKCHKKKFCFNCHEIEMPHPADWKKNHKQLAIKEKAICSNCHEPKYCTNCHGVEMPHPEGWTTSHNKTASFENSSLCFKCHNKQDFCFTCHEQTNK